MDKVRQPYIKTLLRPLLIGKIDILFSAVFSVILVLGYMLSHYESIDITMSGLELILYFCITVVVWCVLLFGLITIKRWSLRKNKASNSILFKNISDKKLWLITSAVIFTCYLPIILTCFSVLSPDSWVSIKQATGEVPLSNAHPIIFTAFVSIFISISLLFGSIEFGTLLFSFAQSVILAMIFAKIIVWMRNEKINREYITATFLFYAILPINAIAGIIMWKDILFAGFGLLLLLSIRKLYIENDKFFTTKNIFYFISLAFLFCTWRNNGYYAYILFIILAVIINRKTLFNKKHLLVLLSPIFLVMIYSALSALISKPTSLAESMSIPLQQIARTVKYHSESISNEDKATINEILPYDKLNEKYNPSLSDPVKGSFNVEAFKKDEVKYIRLWAKLLIDHKKTFLAATLYNTYGYVYPYYTSPTTTDIVPNNASHFNAPVGYSDYAYDSGAKSAVAKYQATTTNIAPILRNIGFYTCVVLFGVYIAIIKRKRELTGVFVLLFCLFLTTILGPVNGEFRYLYLFAIAVPFIIGSVYFNNNPKSSKADRD